MKYWEINLSLTSSLLPVGREATAVQSRSWLADAEISCSPIAEYAIRVIMEAHSYTLVMLVTFGSNNDKLLLV